MLLSVALHLVRIVLMIVIKSHFVVILGHLWFDLLLMLGHNSHSCNDFVPGIIYTQSLRGKIYSAARTHERSLKNLDSCSNNMPVGTWIGFEGKIGVDDRDD